MLAMSMAWSSSDNNAVYTLFSSNLVDDVMLLHNGASGPELKKHIRQYVFRQVTALAAKSAVSDC